MKHSIAASWSGGKDSCLAYYKMKNEGYDIRYLVNFISGQYKRCCFHGIEAALLQKQAEAIGVPILQKEVTQDMKMYELEFKEALQGLKDENINDMVFGDIYLLDHFSWVERVCGEMGMHPHEPLWNIAPEKIAEEFIGLGFKAVVVSCQADKFGREFVGRIFEMEMVKELKNRGFCPCGENGEFHTLVVDGPVFKKRIELTKCEPVLKEGFWKYWFLDIQGYSLVEKEFPGR